MKKAYLKDLQSKLLGSVTDHPDALEHFSTDLSIFEVMPEAVIYPQNTADVRKTVQFAAERAARGKTMSLVPRGKGTDRGGGALGEGVQMVFPTHMNKLLRLEHGTVAVQPGIVFRTLQQTLHTHGQFLPAYPTGLDYSTLGGAVANDASGEKSVKYGSIRSYVKNLKVVLADGSLIETRRISARELSRRKGLATLEGELYRKIDSLLLDHPELIKKHRISTLKNTAGYALDKVKGKDGSFDLSQLFIGSQGTLGLITEITLKTLPYSPRTSLVVGYFDALSSLAEAVVRLRTLGPSALEMVDGHMLEYMEAHRPGDISDLLPEQRPVYMLLVEFDDTSQLRQKFHVNRARHLLARHGARTRVSSDPVEQVALWKVRRSAAAALSLDHGARQALPFMEDAVVPLDRLASFIDKTHKLLRKHDLEVALWGPIGEGNLRLQPFLDLSKKKDVDKLFHLSQEFHELVISLGGSTSGGHNDGLLRALYLKHLYGEEMVELFASLKHICDPHSIFNPMKKTQATEEFARAHLRSSYALTHFYDHIVYI